MSAGRKPQGRAPLAVKRLPVTFASDKRRVITRFFDPGGQQRIENVFARVAQLSSAEVTRVLEEVFLKFRTRHSSIVTVLEQNYHHALSLIGARREEDPNRRMLTGAYVTMEYSIESAALFNPSIVPHLNQRNLPEGAVRFIMSLRATGEGHVSSIVFRTGVLYGNHQIEMDPPSRFTHPIKVVPDKRYERELFQRKLHDIGVPDATIRLVMGRVGERFSMGELETAITGAQEAEQQLLEAQDAVRGMRWLARSNYQLELPSDAEASELVIFPQSSNESRGIEDLRLVRFTNDDGSITYFGTCTAFDGYRTLPELIETDDFQRIGVHTLNGARAQNKGLALFPRKIDGHYLMCSRNDGENLFLMYSDIVHFWESAEILQIPRQPWEFVQLGNCGSPVETSEGWLLLTHGVGPMRSYSIGAMLLDLKDPSKVLGILDEPLITPTEKDRDGYVPNVVYTCGAMVHHDQLYIPFATSDTTTRFGMVSMERLLNRLLST